MEQDREAPKEPQQDKDDKEPPHEAPKEPQPAEGDEAPKEPQPAKGDEAPKEPQPAKEEPQQEKERDVAQELRDIKDEIKVNMIARFNNRDEPQQEEKGNVAQKIARDLAIVRDIKEEFELNLVAKLEEQNAGIRADIANKVPDQDPGENGPLVGVDLENHRLARIARTEGLIANLRRQLAQLELAAAANWP